MTIARDAVERLQAALAALPRIALQSEPASRVLVRSLGATEAFGPSAADLNAVRRRLAEACTQPHGAARLTGRDLRDATHVLLNGNPPAFTFPGLIEAIASRVEESPRLLRSVIEAWLRDFAPSGIGIPQVARLIARLLPWHSDQRLDLWRRLQQEMSLFDPQGGPHAVANLLLTNAKPVDAVLAGMGFDDPIRAAGGYLKTVHQEIVALAPPALRGHAGKHAADRLATFVAPGDKLRFADTKGETVRGLLAPWLDGGAEPSGATREAIRDLMLRIRELGDPRLHPHRWLDAGEPSTAKMRQWLARASLDAFFGLIKEHALDHHWRYREAFWSACLKRGAVDDAWLALGSKVHAAANSLQGLGGAYAKVEGVESEKSALLLRVGPLVLCEWSHNGKLRAWPSDWKNAPKLARLRYTKEELMTLGLPFPANPRFGSGGSFDGTGLRHAGSENNRWQGSVAELLARRANVVLNAAEWRPK